MKRAQRRAQMIEFLARREREGLSYRTLERETGISRNTFAWWAARLRAESRVDAPCESSFVELVPDRDESQAEAEAPIELVVGVHVLRVRRGFDAPTLSRLLTVLSSSC